jgi:hypothetical protein
MCVARQADECEFDPIRLKFDSICCGEDTEKVFFYERDSPSPPRRAKVNAANINARPARDEFK